MRKKIIIQSVGTPDTLGTCFKTLYQAFRNISHKDHVTFDLSKLQWAYPLVLLPVSAYLHYNKSDIEYGQSPIQKYCESIKFPKGIDSIDELQKQYQSKKSYIPISILKKESEDRANLESLFIKMIQKVISPFSIRHDAISYPISELVSNIFDHSRENRGFLFGQYYEKKRFLDICIVDCGRGISACYKDEMGVHKTDADAIEAALQGKSAKKDKERGYGIRTSKSVICNGMKGSFALISGSAAYLARSDKDAIIKLSDFYWKGVIIAFRIPKSDDLEDIDIYEYIE